MFKIEDLKKFTGIKYTTDSQGNLRRIEFKNGKVVEDCLSAVYTDLEGGHFISWQKAAMMGEYFTFYDTKEEAIQDCIISLLNSTKKLSARIGAYECN